MPHCLSRFTCTVIVGVGLMFGAQTARADKPVGMTNMRLELDHISQAKLAVVDGSGVSNPGTWYAFSGKVHTSLIDVSRENQTSPFRLGDYIDTQVGGGYGSEDLCCGQTNSTITAWAGIGIGLQAAYRINSLIDAGLKVYEEWLLIDRIGIFAPVGKVNIRVGSLYGDIAYGEAKDKRDWIEANANYLFNPKDTRHLFTGIGFRQTSIPGPAVNPDRASVNYVSLQFGQMF